MSLLAGGELEQLDGFVGDGQFDLLQISWNPMYSVIADERRGQEAGDMKLKTHTAAVWLVLGRPSSPRRGGANQCRGRRKFH